MLYYNWQKNPELVCILEGKDIENKVERNQGQTLYFPSWAIMKEENKRKEKYNKVCTSKNLDTAL